MFVLVQFSLDLFSLMKTLEFVSLKGQSQLTEGESQNTTILLKKQEMSVSKKTVWRAHGSCDRWPLGSIGQIFSIYLKNLEVKFG